MGKQAMEESWIWKRDKRTMVLDEKCEKYIRRDTGYIPQLYDYGDGEMGYMSAQKARRVVACVNACRHITIKELENDCLVWGAIQNA